MNFEKPIYATGYKALRHAQKYISPFLGQENTHRILKDHECISFGEPVSLHSIRVDDKGKHYVTLSGNSSRKHEVPFNYLEKPSHLIVRKGQMGFQAEDKIVMHLKKHGLMDKDDIGAGSTGGVDFYILNNKIKYGGESKISLDAKMGAISLNFTDNDGWIVSPRSKPKKINFAKDVEVSTIGGKSLLRHLDKHWGDPRDGHHLPCVKSDDQDLTPLHSYLYDHKVDLLHIHTHGTYRGGLSQYDDRMNLELPVPNGIGRFTVGRERAGGTVNIVFRPYKREFEKSHIDMMDDTHIEILKERLWKKKKN